MARLSMSFLLHTMIFSTSLFLGANCNADTVFTAGTCGYGSLRGEVLIEKMELGDGLISPIEVAGDRQGTIYAAAVSPDWTVFFGGKDDFVEGTMLPIIYKISPGEAVATPITIMNVDQGVILDIAATPDGDIICVGSNDIKGQPFAFRIPYGETIAYPIELPLFAGNGNSFLGIAIDANGFAVMAGYEGDKVLICSLAPKAEKAILLENLVSGFIDTVKFRSGGTILAGGQNSSSESPLVYTVNAASGEVTQIDLGSGIQGHIETISVASNGMAILAGENKSTSEPLIYRMVPGSNQVDLIANPFPGTGIISAVSIDLNGRAILGGRGSSLRPIIWSLDPKATKASALELPNSSIKGVVQDIAMDSDGTAVVIGETFGDQSSFVYTLGVGKNTLSKINNALSRSVWLQTAVIVFTNVYDVSRIIPLKKKSNYEGAMQVRQAGL